MAAIEELSPSAGPVSTRPPEDEIDDDEDEDVSVWFILIVGVICIVELLNFKHDIFLVKHSWLIGCTNANSLAKLHA